jgi:hypothetical protein
MRALAQEFFPRQVEGFGDFYYHVDGRDNPLAFYIVEMAVRNAHLVCQIYDGNLLFGSLATDGF